MSAAAAAALNTRSAWRRRLAKYSRSLHIYTSMFSCAVVLFFAITGLTLNHADRFAGTERTRELGGSLDPSWTGADGREPARLEIVEFLREAHHLTGAVSDFRADAGQLSVSFKGPGASPDVFIDRTTGTYQLTDTRLGLIAVANDLHKGRDSGTAWKGLIDASAVFLTFVAVTGLALLYFIHRQRSAGFILLLAGAAGSYLLYVVCVP